MITQIERNIFRIRERMLKDNVTVTADDVVAVLNVLEEIIEEVLEVKETAGNASIRAASLEG